MRRGFRGRVEAMLAPLAVLISLLAASIGVGPAAAQHAETVPDPASAKVQEFVKLLDDPDVRAWLATAPGSTTAPEAPAPEAAAQLTEWDDALRNHLADMAQALGRLPDEMAEAVRRVSQDGGAWGFGRFAVLLFALAAAGAAAEWLARRNFPGAGSLVERSRGRAPDFAVQALPRLAPVFAFAVGSLVAFLVIGGPPLARRIALTYLAAFIVIRAVAAVSDLCAGVILAAGRKPGEAPDAVPAEDAPLVAFWRRRVIVIASYLMVAWATLSLLPPLGVSRDGAHLLGYLAGIGLLAFAIESVWHIPAGDAGRTTARRWLLSIFLVLLWCIWAIGLNIAFWLGVYVLVLPKALYVAGQVASSILDQRRAAGAPVSIRDVLIVRGARALVVLLAVLWIAFVLSINPGVLAAQNTVGGQVVRVLLRSTVILLVADLIWQLIKTYIDNTMSSAPAVGVADSARRGRIRTLLPIFRNALAVLVATVAGLMVLSELGVQIGPLIAGASIFGVAIGFGSQTLVKDIVSGVFYLMDDAFRVGEYIQSGSYKGTVEGFSLRSVRLRHHRGPVYTVPFGSLGAVQNMSRDWAIDKFMLRFPFDTDIKLVKKLTKTVGAALLEDPDIAPDILETVKMKGVEQIGDYGIDISFGMKTKPGYQTSVRRRAYAMLRDSFKANGIEFARPSVNVGGDDEAATAAATLVRKVEADRQAATTG